MYLRIIITFATLMLVNLSTQAAAQAVIGSGANKFAQLEQLLPTPNVYRTASGAPGPDYWQQRADYKINVSLDEDHKRITADAVINYTNRSPQSLNYIWLQLDQNRFKKDSLQNRTSTFSRDEDRLTFRSLRREQALADRDYGVQDLKITDGSNRPLATQLVDTMLRVDLPSPLRPNAKTTLKITWASNIIDQAAVGGRGGYEAFNDKDNNNDTYIFALSQWFPRLAAYTDYTGWQHKQFLGRGEFTLEFGDYDVSITVPAGHIVSATGELQNPKSVLTTTQQQRLAQVTAQAPNFIVTPEEALANEGIRLDGTRTWRFKAKNIRDFAWSSSRKFIWDAMLHKQPGTDQERVLAMSFYPNEAEPLWSQYSTQSVIHTLDVYSRFSFAYPYPTAQSVNAWKRGGMEYPMITFNGYRPVVKDQDEDKDDEKSVDDKTVAETVAETEEEVKTYARGAKYGLIGVVIHEIGHIYFPMVVNSDERQWSWMDEGLNTFLEYVAELEWEEKFPAFGGHTNLLDAIPTYMTSSNQVPIMTNSESILQFGPNAYSKPAAALTVLRETVMGREAFDFAFREYAQRWKFKRPTPADFFRTMEDASAVDLDWFWRGWFYSTDHVDVAITDVREYRLKSKDPEVDFPLDRVERQENEPAPIMEQRNRDAGMKTRLQRTPALNDMYNDNDPYTVSNKDKNGYQSYIKKLEDWEQDALARGLEEAPFIYFVDFSNLGGLVSPLPLVISYADGSSRELMLAAEIWRLNANNVTHVMMETKAVSSISLDDRHQTADADFSNNQFPQRITRSRLALYKSDKKRRDLMADMLVELKGSPKDGESADDKAVPLVPSNAP
ncbi:MAG: hypothetical protein ACJATP_000447 [Candidatus Azotimanducaceae bacterium]|jgi:hypothetical protein